MRSSKHRLAGQLDIFIEAPPPTPLAGRRAVLEGDRCRCGGVTTIVGDGTPPHIASLACASCGRFRGWLSKQEHDAILKIVSTFPIPNEEPFLVRRSARARN
jgi:hypothetical protein